MKEYKERGQHENFWRDLHKDFVSKKSDLTRATLKDYLENMAKPNASEQQGQASTSTVRESPKDAAI